MKLFLYIAVIMTVVFPMKGVQLFQHYCGDEVISFEFFEKHGEVCCDGHTSHSRTCEGCSDRETTWSLDDFDAPNKKFTPSEGITVLWAAAFTHYPTFAISDNKAFIPGNDPPGWAGRHLSILNQSFLL